MSGVGVDGVGGVVVGATARKEGTGRKQRQRQRQHKAGRKQVVVVVVVVAACGGCVGRGAGWLLSGKALIRRVLLLFLSFTGRSFRLSRFTDMLIAMLESDA